MSSLFVSRSRLLLAGTLSLVLSVSAFAEEVAARVNGVDITRAQVDEQINNVLSRMQGQIPPEHLAQFREQVSENIMEQLITKQILDQSVAAEGIAVTDAEIDETVGNLLEQLPPGVTLQQQLEMMNMTEEAMRGEIKDNLAIQKLIESKVGANMDPTDEEIAAFHEQHREEYFTRPASVQASHILIDTRSLENDEAKEEARAKLEGIRKAILDGADFAEQAREHSACPSGAQGGDLGQFVRGQMVPEFDEAAFTQEPGVVGPVIETPFGFHIVLVTGRQDGGDVSLEESRESISEFLKNEKRQGAVGDYIRGLRESAEVEILSP